MSWKRIDLRVSDHEHAQLTEAAKLSRQSLTQYILTKALGAGVGVVPAAAMPAAPPAAPEPAKEPEPATQPVREPGESNHEYWSRVRDWKQQQKQLCPE